MFTITKRFISKFQNLSEYKKYIEYFQNHNFNKSIEELYNVKNILINANDFNNYNGIMINKNISKNYLLLNNIEKGEELLLENFKINNHRDLNNNILLEFYFNTNLEKTEEFLKNLKNEKNDQIFYYDCCLDFIKKDYEKMYKKISQKYNDLEEKNKFSNLLALNYWIKQNGTINNNHIVEKILYYFKNVFNINDFKTLPEEVYNNPIYIGYLLNLGEFFISIKDLNSSSFILSAALKNLKSNNINDLRLCNCLNLLSIIGIINDTLIKAEGLLNQSIKINYNHNSYQLYESYNIMQYLYAKQNRDTDKKRIDEKIVKLKESLPDWYSNLHFIYFTNYP